jgi:hypothetical protein
VQQIEKPSSGAFIGPGVSHRTSYPSEKCAEETTYGPTSWQQKVILSCPTRETWSAAD